MGAIRYIEHTADAGVEISASSREELFILGARALYRLALDYNAVTAVAERRLTLKASDFAELFHEWLAELLYFLDAEGWVFKTFGFNFAAGFTEVTVEMWGEEIDPERHHPHGEVKNVTYSDFAVEERADGFTARVIFDL